MGTVLSLQPKLGAQLRSIPALLPIFFVFIGNDPFSPVLELAQRRGISLGLRMRVFHQGDPAQSHAWLGWAVGAWCFSLSPVQAPAWDRDPSAVTGWAGTVGEAPAAGAGCPVKAFLCSSGVRAGTQTRGHEYSPGCILHGSF